MALLSRQRFSEMLGIDLFCTRLKYPFSLPQDIADAVGIEELHNHLSFEEMIAILSGCPQTKLFKYMPKQKVVEAFQSAYKSDHFPVKSLFFFYFKQGWVEFEATFDDRNCLRRLMLISHCCKNKNGINLPLLDELPKQ